MIDVGVAGVVGADRLLDGDDIYSEDFSSELPESGDVRGDVYGPVNYLAYVPAEQAFPWEDEWDDVPARARPALAFDLLTALALFFSGRRLRRAAATATSRWRRRPRDRARLRVARLSVHAVHARIELQRLAGGARGRRLHARALIAARQGRRRGALRPHEVRDAWRWCRCSPPGTGERRPRTLLAFAAAFAAVAVVVTLPLLPDGGLGELYDRSLGYQASRGSPFSLWGQAPSLDPLQTLSKVFAVGLRGRGLLRAAHAERRSRSPRSRRRS